MSHLLLIYYACLFTTVLLMGKPIAKINGSIKSQAFNLLYLKREPFLKSLKNWRRSVGVILMFCILRISVKLMGHSDSLKKKIHFFVSWEFSFFWFTMTSFFFLLNGIEIHIPFWVKKKNIPDYVNQINSRFYISCSASLISYLKQCISKCGLWPSSES